MQGHALHTCGQIGRKNGVLCAGLGVLAAGLLLTPWGAIDLVINSDRRFQLGLFIGLGALYLAASYFGGIAGRFLCKRNNLITNVIVGVSLAFGSVAISVLTSTVSLVLMNKLGESTDSTDLLTSLVGPLFWVFLFGGGPAIVLGVFYGILVRTQLAKMSAVTVAEQRFS
jgi:hypothetical protein